jgi:hypothetical protein
MRSKDLAVAMSVVALAACLGVAPSASAATGGDTLTCASGILSTASGPPVSSSGGSGSVFFSLADAWDCAFTDGTARSVPMASIAGNAYASYNIGPGCGATTFTVAGTLTGNAYMSDGMVRAVTLPFTLRGAAGTGAITVANATDDDGGLGTGAAGANWGGDAGADPRAELPVLQPVFHRPKRVDRQVQLTHHSPPRRAGPARPMLTATGYVVCHLG